MKKNVLFVILDKYSDWEAAYLSSLILALGQDTFSVKTVSLTKNSIKSLGGFTVIPDYDIESVTADFEGLVLVGGMSWRTEEAKKIGPLVQEALKNKKVLGAICDASVFLGKMGVLNDVRHTSNDINDLKQWAENAYNGEGKYVMEPAVRDNNIITANGTASLEFAKEVMIALEVTPESKINEWYNFYKLGCYEAPMPSM
ncbi:type 1 glutamine amidotransferase family protein [Clostridium sp.]|uniref:type 1 glutamine amidotransferase family protein n=1 Tax=Clostridium sp. TaxID=1506 RepID=UPI002FC82E67